MRIDCNDLVSYGRACKLLHRLSSASRICCEPPVMCNVELVSTAKGLVCVSSAFLCVRESPFNFFR